MFAKLRPFMMYYFVPVAYFVPNKVFNGIYEEYEKNKNKTLTQHVGYCIMGAYSGVFEGLFLGTVWPITVSVWIKRFIDK
jgi:hypothetical protein